MVIYSWFTHWKWWFSIAMLVYQRVFPTRITHLTNKNSGCYLHTPDSPRQGTTWMAKVARTRMKVWMAPNVPIASVPTSAAPGRSARNDWCCTKGFWPRCGFWHLPTCTVPPILVQIATKENHQTLGHFSTQLGPHGRMPNMRHVANRARSHVLTASLAGDHGPSIKVWQSTANNDCNLHHYRVTSIRSRL